MNSSSQKITSLKQLKDESGAFIQISQKSKETTLPERVVTIIGDPNNNRKAIGESNFSSKYTTRWQPFKCQLNMHPSDA